MTKTIITSELGLVVGLIMMFAGTYLISLVYDYSNIWIYIVSVVLLFFGGMSVGRSSKPVKEEPK